MHWQICCRKCRFLEILKSYWFWWHIFSRKILATQVLQKRRLAISFTLSSWFSQAPLLLICGEINVVKSWKYIKEKYHMAYSFSCLLINYIIFRWPFTKLSKIHKYPHDPEIRRFNMRRKTQDIQESTTQYMINILDFSGG